MSHARRSGFSSLSLSLLCLMKHVQCSYLMHDKPPRLVAGRTAAAAASVSPSVLPSAHRAITMANAIGFNLWSRSTTSAKCSTDDGWGWGERGRRERGFLPLTTHENNAGDKGGISRVKRRNRGEESRGERERELFVPPGHKRAPFVLL